MKRLEILVPHEHLSSVNKILYKYKAGGMSFYDIKGRGRSKPSPVSVGRGVITYVPEFAYRIKIEVVVPDSTADNIIKNVLKVLGNGPEAFGKIFVYNVLEAYDIGTNETGDEAL